MKTINITLDEHNQLKIEATHLPLPELIQLCFAGIESSCKAVLNAAPDNLKPSLEEDMYEMINLGASTLLERAFPNVEARPDLTVDAIQAAEDKLFAEKGKEYVDAYKGSAQAVKDSVQDNLRKAHAIKDAADSKKKCQKLN